MVAVVAVEVAVAEQGSMTMDRKKMLANSDDFFHAQERNLADIILEHNRQIEEKEQQIVNANQDQLSLLNKELKALIKSREAAVNSLNKIMKSALTGTNKRQH